MKQHQNTLIVTGIYALAMAFLESAVVVYMRAIYYPDGFLFPLKPIAGTIALTELIREAATMVMLVTVALLAVKEAMNRFALFIYMFAIWDIFYYVFLYLLLGWPETLLTWDILFMIPVTWVGPVLAPVINSLTMILLTLAVMRAGTKLKGFRIAGFDWFLLITGSVITITGYTLPYLTYMLQRVSFSGIFDPETTNALLAGFIPQYFNWFIFGTGEIMFLYSVWRIWSFLTPASAKQ